MNEEQECFNTVLAAVNRAIAEDTLEAWEWLKAWWHGEASMDDPFEGPWNPQNPGGCLD